MVDSPGAPRAPAFSVATDADVAAVVALVESAYRGEESRRGWTTEADLLGGQRTDEEAVAALVQGPGTVLLLARLGGELAGCCCLATRPGGVVRLGMLAVDPGRQGAGLGRAILEEAERRARASLGAEVVELAVVSLRSELVAWYERRGFASTGRREPFPYGDDRFGLPKRDDLAFVVLERRLSPAAWTDTA